MAYKSLVRWKWVLCIAALAVIAAAPWATAKPRTAKLPRTVRLYVFDCGLIKNMKPAAWGYKPEELASTKADGTLELSVPCFLIAGPKGTLMWDVGAVPDTAFGADGAPVTRGVFFSSKTLKSQLAQVGYDPSDITYLALSHYHGDHTANANEFAGSTWLVRQVERDAMFAEKPPAHADATEYNQLRESKTVILKTDDYDVFGDGNVIIKYAPGHTPGHQVLVVKLAKTGPVVIAGDMYHFPEDVQSNNYPGNEFDKDESNASRAMIREYLKKTGAQLWIEHDTLGNAKLKKAPDYYE